MNNSLGLRGLILNEPLLWEKGVKGRRGFSMPRRDVESFPLDKDFAGNGPDFPDLSEEDIIRHYTRLSTWNFGVDTGMYPLGSCTMKYNPKCNEKNAALPGFANAHPMLPDELGQGALKLMYELERYLSDITGMDATTLQPAAGAHGELAGMLLIHAFHQKNGLVRSKILVPDTAHGTNPASATLCGYKSVSLKSNDLGILSPETVYEKMDEDTAGIMVTNPNTLGLFEDNILEISEIVHKKGGIVYGDGANMNALMGMVSVGKLGIDILHLNLHKTFSTPHGGGGPGAGPVCVKAFLEPFLPVPRVKHKDDTFSLSWNHPDSIGKLHSFYGSFGVMIKAYCYILSMGAENLKKASGLAVLNANYIKEKLKKVLHLPFDRPCMHECVFSDKFQKENKITTFEMAKRLMDYGFHPPTVYFPLVVNGALMIEPTETECKKDIDEFINAVKSIVKEAKENPERLRSAPEKCKVKKLDETAAARQPCLAG